VAWSPPPDLRHSGTIEKERDSIETRRLETTALLSGLLASSCSGSAQVCHITRQRIIHGKESIEIVHAILSLTAEKAGPQCRLALLRLHWGTEKRQHYVRDFTCGENPA
jgi:hypothetical protein